MFFLAAGWSGRTKALTRRCNTGRAAFSSALLALAISSNARADGAEAEEARENGHSHRLQISGGLGIAFPSNDEASDTGAQGIGAYARAEYIHRVIEAVTPRAYAGVVFAPKDGDCELSPCDVSARILFMGVKARLLAPIPYVAPFIEFGLGGSLGKLTTRVDEIVDSSKAGATYHIPIGLGLALGERHQYELAFEYLLHPEVHQVCGALAFGFELPLQ
jgi:hypothetical protein